MVAVASPERIRRALAKLTPEERAELDALLTAPDAPPFLPFRAWVERHDPRFIWYRHAEVLGEALQGVADGRITRLMVFEPPRHGKSREVSIDFPAYYLSRFPERWAAVTSYSGELAHRFSRAARELYTNAGGTMRGDAASVKEWMTEAGGGMWATGVGGAATGKGFHLGIVDDPIKDHEQANSARYRERAVDWYNSTFYTRAEPGAAIVVMHTRWHQLDLAGTLLDELAAGGGDGERWHVLNLEAIKEPGAMALPPGCVLLPDWRATGEPLCPERFDLRKLRSIEQKLGPYHFAALYQQRPRPREGGFFKWAWFLRVPFRPAEAKRVRYWDTAGTEGGGDYTVGCLMAKTPQGRFVIEDVVRGQWSPGRRDAEIVETAARDAARYGRGAVKIWLEQEAGVGGTDRTAALVKKLAGHTIRTEPATGKKTDRADPLASAAEAGNVALLEAAWNKPFLDELTSFPTGDHDDQVDAAAGAFNKLNAGDAEGWGTFDFEV